MRRVKTVLWVVSAALAALLLIAPRLLAESGDRGSPSGIVAPAPASVQQVQPAGIEAGLVGVGAQPAQPQQVQLNSDVAGQQPAARPVVGNQAGLLSAPALQVEGAFDPAAAGIDTR